nr:hypothetical protein [Algoriphagus resistens]
MKEESIKTVFIRREPIRKGLCLSASTAGISERIPAGRDGRASS